MEQVGVFGGEPGVEGAVPGGDKVGGGKRLAVRPLQAGPEVKRPRQAVGGCLPAFRGGGHGRGGSFIERAEALEEREGDILIRESRHELRIEILGLSAVAEVQDLFADSDVGHGFLAGAAAQKTSRRQGYGWQAENR